MRFAFFIGILVPASACLPDNVCDPGQRYELGNCFNVQEAADASTDAGQDAGAACTPGPDNYEGFGEPCMADSDCASCIAPTCVTTPINQCSRKNCQDDADACPPRWQCTDISAFSPDTTVTHICLPL